MFLSSYDWFSCVCGDALGSGSSSYLIHSEIEPPSFSTMVEARNHRTVDREEFRDLLFT
jgi:hypothetical protein